MSEDSKSQTEALVQSQAESIKNLEIQIGHLAYEIKKQTHDTLPSDTENLEDVEKKHFKIVLVEREKFLEVAQINSGHEGRVDDFSEVSTMDVLVSDKLEQYSYEDPLEQLMINSLRPKNNEDDHLAFFEVNSPDTRLIRYFESLEVPYMQAKSPKTSIEELPNSELQSEFSQTEDVYLISSPMVSIIILANLPPDRKEDLLKVIQKCKKVIGWAISKFCDIICCVCMKILLEDSRTCSFEARRQIKLLKRDVVPNKIIKWPLKDVRWNFALNYLVFAFSGVPTVGSPSIFDNIFLTLVSKF